MAATFKCPSCGYENIPGEDRCVKCFHSLMQTGLPEPAHEDAIQSAMLTAPIAEIVTGEDLLVAAPQDTMDKIIDLFHAEKKNCILVYKSKHLLGILSRRDVLIKVAGIQEDLSKVTVESVMTSNPEFVRAEDPIAFVVNKMSLGGFRHVPVLAANGTPITIITIQDVLRYLAHIVK